jgi:hypothetical protein
VWTQERDDEGEEPRPSAPYVDGAWGRTANPNTADGELQNIAAFGTGLTRLTGWRRTAAKVVVWLILISVGLAIIDAIFGIARG